MVMKPDFFANGLKAPDNQAAGQASNLHSDLKEPTSLHDVVSEMVDRAKNDSAFAAEAHYILLQLGERKTLIKADLSQHPHEFILSNLEGRPGLLGERAVLKNFGEFYDLYAIKTEARLAKIEATITGENIPLPENKLEHAFQELSTLQRQTLPEHLKASEQAANVTRSWSSFFSSKPHDEQTPKKELDQKVQAGPKKGPS